MASELQWAAFNLLKRQADDTDPDAGDENEPEGVEKEFYASWSLFILIMLLIVALFTSYLLQTRKIQAVHETVISIFAGMVVGLILRLTAGDFVLDVVSFDDSFFFNLLLPPIILASGFELHQGNFFRHMGPILTFAFAGTFISALVLGIVLWLWTRLPFDGMNLTFVDALSVGATLSATDPVTILAIFNTYKVDPDLYTVIFGESILNDAIAIVLFETARKYSYGASEGQLTVLSLFESIGEFLLVFFGSLVIGLVVGVLASLMLKGTMVRRFPKIESCIIFLIAYASYFFSNAIRMSGIVSLLFCGICMKHYAYHNMSRRTQLTTKFVFQVLAQLSENFIFIYLGLSLFTDKELSYKPLFILISVVGICVARWCAVFPLSRAINSFVAYKAKRKGREASESLPFNHQMMLFWAGLRGAVGVALAAGLTGPYHNQLRATVLVVVVLTVIIFGGTTARMLEILNIRTGVVEEIDSDDEFDIEVVNGGTYSRNAGKGFGHNPRNTNGFALANVEGRRRPSDADRDQPRPGMFRSGSASSRSTSRVKSYSRRRSSSRNVESAEQGLLSPGDSGSGEDDAVDLDLPPNARRFQNGNGINSPRRTPAEPGSSTTALPASTTAESSLGMGGSTGGVEQPSRFGAATGAISQLFSGLSEDPATAFRQIDESFIKPHLLLDPGRGGGDRRHGGGSSGGH